ncbi:MAG: hypothetical protein ABWW70_05735 [Thermoproteota archaeon]
MARSSFDLATRSWSRVVATTAWTALLLAALFLALLAAPKAAAESRTVIVYNGRHTLLFPEVLRHLNGSMRISLTMDVSSNGGHILSDLVLEDRDELLISRDIISEIASWEDGGYTPEEREALKVYAESSRLSEAELLSRISNPILREELEEVVALVRNAKAVPAHIVRAMSSTEYLYVAGKITTPEYVAAMELLRRLAATVGNEYLSSEVAERLLNAIEDVLRKGHPATHAVQELLRASSRLQERGQGSTQNPALPRGILGVSGVPLPAWRGAGEANLQLASELPQGLKAVLYVAALASIASMIAAALPDVLVHVSRRAPSPLRHAASRVLYRWMPNDRELARAPLPVRLYWKAVMKISLFFPRSPYQTHREYLDEVKRRTESWYILTGLEMLTRSYEEARFAGNLSGNVELEAIEGYRRVAREKF